MAEKAGEEVLGFDELNQPGLEAICGLLKKGNFWVKLSAPYRCSEMYPAFQDIKTLVQALVSANPDRILYGSDFPHTQPFHRRPTGLKGTDIETYVNFDDAGYLRSLKSWLSDENWQKIMVKNPRIFFDFVN